MAGRRKHEANTIKSFEEIVDEMSDAEKENLDKIRKISIQIGYAFAASMRHAISETPRDEAPTLEKTWSNVADKVVEFAFLDD